MANPTISTVAQGVTGDLVIDAMTTGYKWNLTSDRTIDWAISGGFNGEYWTDPAAVRQEVQAALSLVSYYADVRFNYVGSFSTPSAAYAAGSEITVTMDGANQFFSSSNTWAKGYFPAASFNTAYVGSAGDVFLNMKSDANTLASYDPGSQGFALLLHELGHALGLKHPHDSGGTGHPTFEKVGIEDLDINFATVMSYADEYDWNELFWHPATPMLLDVLAYQALYGVNTSTNAGDTTFNLLANQVFSTIWDAGGRDTVSAASSGYGWAIMLPSMHLSATVPTAAGVAAPMSDLELDAPHTLTWLTGDIEDVVGSRYADQIEGNDLGNRILAGAGNDEIVAGNGTNYLRGEEGNDSIAGGAGFDDINGNQGNDLLFGREGDDWVVGGQNNDEQYGGEGADVVYGNLGNDTLSGGSGADWVRGGQGDDSVSGGADADWLSGDLGNDTIAGGAGADIFRTWGGTGVDRVLDFVRADGDRVQLDLGTAYTTAQVGADTVISMTGGGQMVLVGVTLSSLTAGWIYEA